MIYSDPKPSSSAVLIGVLVVSRQNVPSVRIEAMGVSPGLEMRCNFLRQVDIIFMDGIIESPLEPTVHPVFGEVVVVHHCPSDVAEPVPAVLSVVTDLKVSPELLPVEVHLGGVAIDSDVIKKLLGVLFDA